MDGVKMEMEVETAVLFVENLADTCLFNVISFGSEYSFMFPDSSVSCSTQNK